MADKFLEVVDFVSIGTNDLTQYVMAADRLSPHLAEYTDPWQPGVLAMIANTAAAGKKLSKPVGVCGEAAADPILACVLIGMGVTSLSMAASAVSAVGAQISAVSLAQCQAAAKPSQMGGIVGIFALCAKHCQQGGSGSHRQHGLASALLLAGHIARNSANAGKERG